MHPAHGVSEEQHELYMGGQSSTDQQFSRMSGAPDQYRARNAISGLSDFQASLGGQSVSLNPNGDVLIAYKELKKIMIKN